MAVKSNDLKKGDVIYIKGSGWKAEIVNGKKGNIKDVLVYGDYKEYGTVYVWDIARVVQMGGVTVDEKIELTPSQVSSMKAVKAAGF